MRWRLAPRWRSSWAGTALELQRLFPPGWALPDVLVALIVGSIVVNSPLSKWLGLAAHDRGRNRYGAGLTFVGKAVLRASVVLMGLRIEARLFESRQLMAIALGLVTALPTTFFVTRALAIPLRVPRRLADLIASGTMICGASAVNAVAPVIGARRQEQGVALATIFLYSAVALVLFRTVAAAAGLDAHQGGIWSGLAVNDLASAVAVGAQMGTGGRRDGGRQQVGARPDAGAGPDPVLALARRPGDAAPIVQSGSDARWSGTSRASSSAF